MKKIITGKDDIFDTVSSKKEESDKRKEQESEFDNLRLIFATNFLDFSVFDIGV